MRQILKKYTWVWIVPLCLAASPSLAANNEQANSRTKLEPVVVSATLNEQKLSQAPASIEVISQAQIQEMGADTVAQALEEAVGLVLNTESGRAMRPSIRGTGSQHTLVLVDGRRLAPGYRGMTDINQIPTIMIERIEVVRGPSSALFGSDALGGVVNIITKQAPREKIKAEADIKAGTNTGSGGQTFLPQGLIGAGLGKFRFLASGSFKNRNGWEHDNEPPDDGDEVKQQYGAGKGVIDFSENHSVSFGGSYNNFERIGQRDIQNTLAERDATDKISDVFLRYDGKFTKNTNLMLQAYHSEYETDVDLNPAIKSPFLLLNEKYKRTQYEGRFNAKLNEMLNLTLGAESRQDTRGSDNLSTEYDTDNHAGFGQLDMLFFDRLNLVAGVRLDDHSEFGSEWSPKMAASFIINPNLRLKASYGHGFRAPTSYELYVTAYKRRGKDIYLPNKDLEPETTDSYEIGLQSNLDVAEGLDLELTWFRNDIDDLIEAMPLASKAKGKSKVKRYQYSNIAEATTSGLELLGNLRLPFNFTFGAGMTCLDTENKDTGEQLPNQPRFKGNLNATWKLKDLGLKTRLSFNWYSGQEDGLGNSLDDYSVVNAWVGKDLCQSFMLYAGMKNIFDTDREEYNIAPAYVYLGVRWEY
ncbi:TonB-dependent receptor plug domain-containing protein [Dethiosulfatarculus sandiegensis]|uniref:TonB-denpendent receptor n=1 Tax=Dethiosulfatarculus sandiegensis TaxID=1429043 RepID=A0A0D2GL04_9BACT|nr:TonB-dependent receptor [Dethiosulfatarculus sandiegensis]KIX15407.1 hypothetical protein X474_03595 [Dethiosulfatarculus sandiegensis]